MEGKRNFPIEERYEDEIDLMELIKVLIRGKFVIIGITLLILLGGAVGGFYLKNKSYNATTFITFNFQGIEKGQNPDGSAFDIGLMTSTAVLEKVYEKFPILGDKGIRIENIKRAFSAEGVIPNLVNKRAEEALKNNEDYAYNPFNYKLSLNLTGDRKLDRQILESMIREYSDYFNFRFNRTETLGKITNGFETYDYVEFIEIANNNVSRLKAFLEEKKKINYRSQKYLMTFSDILTELNILESIEIKNLDSIVQNNNLTKDKTRLIDKYTTTIRELKLEKAKSNAEKEIIKDMLNNYKPSTTQVIVPNLEGSLTESSGESYYSKLISRATEAGVKVVSLDEEIKYIQQKIDEIRANGIEKTEYINTADKLVKLVGDKLNNLIDKTNDITKEYKEIYFSNMIKKITPVETVSDFNLKLILMISVVLGMFLGIFAVFLLEFKRKLNN